MVKIYSVLFSLLMIIPLSSFAPSESSDINSRERNWFTCQKCFTIFYGGRSSQGVCPSGGEHQRGAVELLLNMSDCGDCYSENCENDFYFCKNCSCLFYTPDKTKSAPCPAGGKHAAENWDFRYYLCKSRGGKPVFKDEKVSGNQECRFDGYFCINCHCYLTSEGGGQPCAGSKTHKANSNYHYYVLAADSPCGF